MSSLLRSKLKKIIRPIYKKCMYLRHRGVVMKNRALQGKYKGKRIFILGDGSSLRDIDLSLLAGEYTMACNYIALHKDFQKLDLKFYASAATWRAIQAHNLRIQSLPQGVRPPGTYEETLAALAAMTQGRPTRFFFEVSMKKFIDRSDYFRDREVCYTVSGAGLLDPVDQVQFDLTKPLPTMEGSLFFMVSLASYMGFSEIYLCGCGYTYVPMQHGHFYDNITLIEGNELDRRHSVLQDIAARNDVTIYNVIPDGFQSPVYKPVFMKDLQQLLL